MTFNDMQVKGSPDCLQQAAFELSSLLEAISFSDPTSFALSAGTRRPRLSHIPKWYPCPMSHIMPAVKDPKVGMRAKKPVGDVVRGEDMDTRLRKASKPKSGTKVIMVNARRGYQHMDKTRIPGDR